MVNTPFLYKTGESDGQIAPWLAAQIDSGQILSPDDVAEAAIRVAADTTRAGEYEVVTPESVAEAKA